MCVLVCVEVDWRALTHKQSAKNTVTCLHCCVHYMLRYDPFGLLRMYERARSTYTLVRLVRLCGSPDSEIPGVSRPVMSFCSRLILGLRLGSYVPRMGCLYGWY